MANVANIFGFPNTSQGSHIYCIIVFLSETSFIHRNIFVQLVLNDSILISFFSSSCTFIDCCGSLSPK